MPKNFNNRDRKLKKRKDYKSDNRNSVRNLQRIILQKARDIHEKKHRQIKENALWLDNERQLWHTFCRSKNPLHYGGVQVKVTISEEQFKAFEEIRESGDTNMMDTRKVSMLSYGVLSRDDVKSIITEYIYLRGVYQSE